MPSLWEHLANSGYYYYRREKESMISLGSFWLRSPSRLLCLELLVYSMQASISGFLFMLTPAFREYTPSSFHYFARMPVGEEMRMAQLKPDWGPEPNFSLHIVQIKKLGLRVHYFKRNTKTSSFLLPFILLPLTLFSTYKENKSCDF